MELLDNPDGGVQGDDQDKQQVGPGSHQGQCNGNEDIEQVEQGAYVFPDDLTSGLCDGRGRGVAAPHLPQAAGFCFSSATFPSYFLKDEGAVIQGHARLDLALFGQIAKSLNITARYAGEELSSQVTGLYNRVMARELPKEGIQFVEVPRKTLGEVPISASTVRKLIHDGELESIRPLVPEPTWQFFHTPEAAPVITAIQAAGNVIHY